jgi:DNA-binding NtrC family response regulator
MLQYDWPGNVRELEHVIEGAVILSHDDLITVKDITLTSSAEMQKANPPSMAAEGADAISLEEMEKIHIERALRQNNYNRSKTSELLGITPKTLYLKVKKYRIKTPARN